MSFLTQSYQVVFRCPLCLIPSTSYVIQHLTQSLSSFRSTFPNHLNLLIWSSNFAVICYFCDRTLLSILTLELQRDFLLWYRKHSQSSAYYNKCRATDTSVIRICPFPHSTVWIKIQIACRFTCVFHVPTAVHWQKILGSGLPLHILTYLYRWPSAEKS